MCNHKLFPTLALWLLAASIAGSQPLPVLESLARAPDYQSHRISSYDRTGGNNDRLNIQPGETKVLAKIQGPGAITHIWNTIDAEKYYPRMLVLRFYWDGQKIPSVEVPLGDFFGVGHGLNQPFQSLPVDVSSEGRARNCYWFMPFEKSAMVTVTHEGFWPVRAFYYYIDYRTYDSLPGDMLYFHAHYRQATPNPTVDLDGRNLDGRTNYLLMETTGKGLYAGTVLSVQINRDGWFGEGDDMFFVDGVRTPTMTGTGTEDYFNDAWGFREFCYPLHGVTVWEGYSQGDRGTAYKWHAFDPVAFRRSLRATIEHGHANDRQDDFYSVAFWYQTLPSPKPPAMPEMVARLPDEGQLYAKRIDFDKRLASYAQQRYSDYAEYALERVQRFEEENERADEYGYWSMRRAILLKQLGQRRQTREAFEAALEKSRKEDRWKEHDGDSIRWVVDRELPVMEEFGLAHLYVAADDTYEVFLDGDSIAKGGGRDRLGDFKIELSSGKHVVAARCENRTGPAGLVLQLSHRQGYLFTDRTWKVSTTYQTGWNTRKFDDSGWPEAMRVGSLGEDPWNSPREPFAFIAPLLFAKVIWSPYGVEEDQMVYFRKELQIR